LERWRLHLILLLMHHISQIHLLSRVLLIELLPLIDRGELLATGFVELRVNMWLVLESRELLMLLLEN